MTTRSPPAPPAHLRRTALRIRQQALRARSAALRSGLAREAAAWQAPLALGDRAIALWQWARAHRRGLGVVVTAWTLWRPRRAQRTADPQRRWRRWPPVLWVASRLAWRLGARLGWRFWRRPG